jgi:hypothetical protein
MARESRQRFPRQQLHLEEDKRVPRSDVAWQGQWLRRANAGLVGYREAELAAVYPLDAPVVSSMDPNSSSDEGKQPADAERKRELERGHVSVTLSRPTKVDLYDIIAEVWQIYEPRRVTLDFEVEPRDLAEED